MLDVPAPAAERSEGTRRSFLIRLIRGVHATMAATLAYILGSAVVAPSLARRERLWLAAVEFASLNEAEPHAVTLRIARQDGATEAVDRRVVFLVRTGSTVRALDSTCTHLGCRTRFNPDAQRIECPCHGGLYDLQGRVLSGPPPRPLDELPTRLDGSRVLVQV
jgi:Rieske Fe-S protein